MGSHNPERIPPHQSSVGLGKAEHIRPWFGLYMFERASLAIVENYIYWCIRNLSDFPGDQIRYSSVLRAIETAGVAVEFGVGAIPSALIATASINSGLRFIALSFSYYATLQVVRKFNDLDRKQNEAARES